MIEEMEEENIHSLFRKPKSSILVQKTGNTDAMKIHSYIDRKCISDKKKIKFEKLTS